MGILEIIGMVLCWAVVIGVIGYIIFLIIALGVD